MGVSKSFGTNITENHFGTLSALFFGHALDQVGQKCRYLAQNASFGPEVRFPKLSETEVSRADPATERQKSNSLQCDPKLRLINW